METRSSKGKGKGALLEGPPEFPDLDKIDAKEHAKKVIEYAANAAAYYAAVAAQTKEPTKKTPRISSPEPFNGSRKDFRKFMVQCQMNFNVAPEIYDEDEAKIAFAGSYLRDQAAQWFEPHINIDTGKSNFSSWQDFTRSLAAAFDDPDRIATAERELKRLKQGKDTASKYHAKFVSIITVLDLGQRQKISAFRDGLSKEVRQALTTQVSPPKLFDDYVNMVIKIDNNIRSLRQEEEQTSSTPSKGSGSSKSPSPTPTSTTTGQKPTGASGGSRRGPLTAEEKKRRRDNNLCSYCGGEGHFANKCPKKSKNANAAQTAPTKGTAQAAPASVASANTTLLYVAETQPALNSQN